MASEAARPWTASAKWWGASNPRGGPRKRCGWPQLAAFATRPTKYQSGQGAGLTPGGTDRLPGVGSAGARRAPIGLGPIDKAPPAPAQPKRYYGTAHLDPTRVGRDASRIAEELIAHLTSLASAGVTVILEIQAHIPNGAPDSVVRTVTENTSALKMSGGVETE